MRRAGCKFLACLFAALALLGCTRTDDHATGASEKNYAAFGPQNVTVAISSKRCDHRGNRCDLYYPTNLAAGIPHPIITWGNGTGGVSSGVLYFLRHLASFGFVVVATRDRFTGDGTTILDAANFMVQENSDPSSIFFNKLDTNHIGAIGHSQGAGGAIRAMIASNGKISTVMPIELPGQQFCLCSPNQVLDTANITQGSVFFVDGSNDIPISPPIQLQPPLQVGEQSLAAFYAAVPNAVPKITATLIGPTHNDISGQPDCDTATSAPCIVGVYGYLGYPTAWMAGRLGLDPGAHAAFVGGTGEIFSQTFALGVRPKQYPMSNDPKKERSDLKSPTHHRDGELLSLIGKQWGGDLLAGCRSDNNSGGVSPFAYSTFKVLKSDFV